MAEEDPEAAAYAAQAAVDLPDLDPQWHWIWRAWHRLDAERHWAGGGMGPDRPCAIPWTAVEAWADRQGLSGPETDLLDHVLQAMDRVFAEWWVERQRQDSAAQ